jgi:hypothetical protein
MPAREMYFSFNKDIELNKENVQLLKEMIINFFDKKDIQKIKDAFCTEEFDKNFFKFFIKELKSFSNVSIEERGAYCSEKTKAIMPLIQEIICDEPSEPTTPLGLKYLYDEWEYEGCGSEDHYYLSFSDENKEIKKFTKEAETAIKKLNSIGVKAKLVVEQ